MKVFKGFALIAMIALTGCQYYPLTGQSVGPDDPVKSMSAGNVF